MINLFEKDFPSTVFRYPPLARPSLDCFPLLTAPTYLQILSKTRILFTPMSSRNQKWKKIIWEECWQNQKGWQIIQVLTKNNHSVRDSEVSLILSKQLEKIKEIHKASVSSKQFFLLERKQNLFTHRLGSKKHKISFMIVIDSIRNQKGKL